MNISEGFPRRWLWLAALTAIFVLNVWIVWRWFFIDYLQFMASVEGYHIALVRLVAKYGRELAWFPFWYCGMPFELTYQPLLPALGGALSELAGLSAARAYHVGVAALYSAGPVALALLTRRLSGSYAAGAVAGLLYSLFSPSLLLSSELRLDSGGWLVARKLHSAVVYGDGPHVASLTFALLALLALDVDLKRKTLLSSFLCALAFSAVALTNLPGTIALALAVAAYLLGADREDWIPYARRTILAAGLGYGLCALLIPPSALLHILANTQRMESVNEFDGTKLFYWLCTAAVAVLLRYGLRRSAASFRFAAVFAWLMGAIVLGAYWWEITLLAQPKRFHFAMETALLLATVLGCWPAIARARRVRYPLLVAFVLFLGMQVDNYRDFARERLQPIHLESRSEYRVARWFAENAGGRRVYAAGATAFWLNVFSDTPQIGGCCQQGNLLPAVDWAKYVIGADDGAEGDAAAVSLAWLQTLGAHFIAVHGPGSTDPFQEFAHPAKFEGLLEAVWRRGGDVIYRVPQRDEGLAHVIRPEERITAPPHNGVDVEPLLPYAEAVSSPARPRTHSRWTSFTRAEIGAVLEPGDLISVQTPYHPGWRAQAQGRPAAVSSDAIGMIVLQPRCSGSCKIVLEYHADLEKKIAALATAGAWAALGAGLALRRRGRRAGAGKSAA